MLVNTLQCSGWPLMTKGYLAQGVNRAKVEKLYYKADCLQRPSGCE